MPFWYVPRIVVVAGLSLGAASSISVGGFAGVVIAIVERIAFEYLHSLAMLQHGGGGAEWSDAGTFPMDP